MEERFVFPIGRRTWQILALLALLGLAAFILWFFINATPTGRDSVSVSKNEVVNNQIDTTSAPKENKEPTSCSSEDYEKQLAIIKNDLPNSEWNKLGDSTEPYSTYLMDDYGNYATDEEGNYVFVTKRDFRKNEDAIPNILDAVYNERGLDSSQFCEKIEILKCLHALNSLTQSSFLQKEAFGRYAYIIGNSREITEGLIGRSVNLKNKIEDEQVQIKDANDLNSFLKLLNYVNSKNITDEQITICVDLLDEHRKLSPALFNKKNYFDIAVTLFESGIETAELKNAVNGFKEDIKYYDQHDLDKSLNRYLKLYEDKLALAEMEKSRKQLKKEANRMFSLMAIGSCFISIILIATILLLYSIQQLLKDHTVNKK